jgi:nitrate/nitrite transporter NarK
MATYELVRQTTLCPESELKNSTSITRYTSLHLNAAQQGLIVAIPTLSGSLFRFPVGLLSDRFSTRWIGVGMLLFLFLPLLLGWLLPVNSPALLGTGMMLGVAGASGILAQVSDSDNATRYAKAWYARQEHKSCKWNT